MTRVRLGMSLKRMFLPVLISGWCLNLQINTVSSQLVDEDDTTVPISSSFTDEEQIFLNVPSAWSARSNLRFITRQPHVAGTLGDQIMADFVVQEFQQAGIPNVSIFDLQVLLNYPKEPPKVTLYENSKNNTVLFKAKLSEDILPQDDTSDTFWRNHTFHGYSPSGNVRGSMVYANYGRPQDFEALEAAGITIDGTIVLVRYGQCFRGLKVMNAQQRGAVGVLIYSDPADDGYGQGEVYPDGAWRSASSVQRGSVQFNSQCAGDPMRADPRYATQLNTTLQDLCGVNSTNDLVPSIPSLPLSYSDATPLLQHMDGSLAKEVGGDDFCGGIRNVIYRVGPSKAVLELVVRHVEEIRKIPNVVGVIPGLLPPDQDMPVLLGNHRDAWVYGAADPNSGTAALLEVAKGLGKLHREHGWRPLRTIYLLSWSGEEYGLLGSTGWAELNAKLISRAIAYLNVDTVVSGDRLKVSASPSLTTLWRNVMADLNATNRHSVPFRNGPFGDIRDANTDWEWDDDEVKPDGIGILGSGSDYTAFLDHFGIPSLDFSFSKKATYGQYHSIYDSFAWMDRYGGYDGKVGSSFDIIAFSSKIWGLLALRLSTSEIVPLDHIAQGVALTKYTEFLVQQKVGLNVRNLTQSVNRYKEAAAILQLHCSDTTTLPDEAACNEKIGLAERHFLLKEGLPKRPWFKHILQAPGMYLGYAAEAFPGIQQAIDEGNLHLAQKQVQLATERVHAAAESLDTINVSGSAKD